MNRIVKDHYPAERLPADLQDLVDPSRPIRIVIELDAYRASIKGRGLSTDEAVAQIRELRDEWDD